MVESVSEGRHGDTVDIREFGIGKHRTVDGAPAGGGAGMVMRCDVLGAAIDHARLAVQARTGTVDLLACDQSYIAEDSEYVLFVLLHWWKLLERTLPQTA